MTSVGSRKYCKIPDLFRSRPPRAWGPGTPLHHCRQGPLTRQHTRTSQSHAPRQLKAADLWYPLMQSKDGNGAKMCHRSSFGSSDDETCSVAWQQQAYSSHFREIILPLERDGLAVDVFVTYNGVCPSHQLPRCQELADLLGRHRLLAVLSRYACCRASTMRPCAAHPMRSTPQLNNQDLQANHPFAPRPAVDQAHQRVATPRQSLPLQLLTHLRSDI